MITLAGDARRAPPVRQVEGVRRRLGDAPHRAPRPLPLRRRRRTRRRAAVREQRVSAGRRRAALRHSAHDWSARHFSRRFSSIIDFYRQCGCESSAREDVHQFATGKRNPLLRHRQGNRRIQAAGTAHRKKTTRQLIFRLSIFSSGFFPID